MSDPGDFEVYHAPSPLSDSAVRKLAKRRGYRLRKKYGKDLYWLEDENGNTTVANEDCTEFEDCLFTKYEVVDFLRPPKEQ